MHTLSGSCTCRKYVTWEKRRAEDFFSPWKIRPGLNPRTWVPKASTLPLDHRSPFSPPYNHNVFKSSRDSLLVYAHYLYVCCCLHQPHWHILVRCGTDGCLHVINTQCLAFCFSIYIYEKILDYRNMKRNAAKLERSAGKRPLARLLPITLVRKKICDMLSGEIGNFGRIMYKITTSSEKNTSLYTIFWYIGRVRTSRLLLRLWRCFRVEWFGLHLVKGCDGIAALIPCKKKKTPSEAFGIHQWDSCFILDQRGGREASPGWVRRQFLADTRANRLKGKAGTMLKRCFNKNFLQCRTQLI